MAQEPVHCSSSSSPTVIQSHRVFAVLETSQALFPTLVMLHIQYLHLGIHFSLPSRKEASHHFLHEISSKRPSLSPRQEEASPISASCLFPFWCLSKLDFFLKFESVLHLFLPGVWGQEWIHHSNPKCPKQCLTQVRYSPYPAWMHCILNCFYIHAQNSRKSDFPNICGYICTYMYIHI